MLSDKRCEIKCVFPYEVGIRIMSIHISCNMYLCLGLHVQSGYVMYCHIKENFGPAWDRFYFGSMFCVLRTDHAKFAKEASANFQNIQH